MFCCHLRKVPHDYVVYPPWSPPCSLPRHIGYLERGVAADGYSDVGDLTMPQSKEQIYERVAHPYFRETEPRYERGSGLELALGEMEARRRKTEALREVRQAAERSDETATHSIGGAGRSSS